MGNKKINKKEPYKIRYWAHKKYRRTNRNQKKSKILYSRQQEKININRKNQKELKATKNSTTTEKTEERSKSCKRTSILLIIILFVISLELINALGIINENVKYLNENNEMCGTVGFINCLNINLNQNGKYTFRLNNTYGEILNTKMVLYDKEKNQKEIICSEIYNWSKGELKVIECKTKGLSFYHKGTKKELDLEIILKPRDQDIIISESGKIITWVV